MSSFNLRPPSGGLTSMLTGIGMPAPLAEPPIPQITPRGVTARLDIPGAPGTGVTGAWGDPMPEEMTTGGPFPQLTPQQLLDLRFMQQPAQPDYGQQIGAAVGGFENASKAYQTEQNRLLGEDELLINKAVDLKIKRDNDLAGIAELRQKAAAGADEALRGAQKVNKGIQESTSKEIGELYNELKKNSEIDPDRYMKNQSTGSMIATAISLVLGGIGSGLTGGPNHAVQILENRINNDIRSQIEKKNGLKDLLAEKREQLGDARANMLGTANLIQLDSAQKMLSLAAQAEKTELSSAGKLEGNVAGMLKNGFRRKAQDKFMGINESLYALKIKGAAEQADIAASKQGIAARSADQILPNQMAAIGPVTPEGAKDARIKMGDYNEVMGHLDILEKLRQKSGKSGVWTGQDKYEALQTSKALFNAKRKLTGSGAALSPMETKLLEMKDPNKMTIGTFDDVLGEIRAEKGVIKRSFQDQIRGSNIVLREAQEQQQLTQGWQAQ